MDLDALHMPNTGLFGNSQCRRGDGVADALAKQKGLHVRMDRENKNKNQKKKTKKKWVRSYWPIWEADVRDLSR